MKMIYFKGEHSNFGDELNVWMWPKILPDFFDEKGDTLFIGIGSTISNSYDAKAKKIIFGAGYVGAYNTKPDVSSQDWDVYFVRGPRTARALNISPDLALGDAAILIRTIVDTSKKSSEVVSFMPHWESLKSGNWQQVCKWAGLNFIDPRWSVERITQELLRSSLLVSEAMHGAIVADALRTPWVPMMPINLLHREKWFDWAEALDLRLEPYVLWPSTLQELRQYLQPIPEGRAKRSTNGPLLDLIQKGVGYIAAQRLVLLAKNSGYLSDDAKIERTANQMLDKVEQVRKKYRVT